MIGIKKVKWFLAVLGVFLVILATNLIDKENFLRVEESVESIYYERLLAKELLLDVSIKFHEKELAYALKDSNYLQIKNDLINAEIEELLLMFERTKATKQEKFILEELQESHSELIALESELKINEVLYSDQCRKVFTEIHTYIVELSAEQIKEGKNKQVNARKAVDTMKLFSTIEIYMLIFLALILQVIILYSPKDKKSKTEESES